MPNPKRNKISSQFNQKDVSTAIIERFGSHKECAIALGISEQNLSHKLKRLSNKFIHQLKSVGVNIPPIDYGFSLNVNNEHVKEHPQQYKDCMMEIQQLKTELLQTKKLLTISLDKITDLEMENEKLRVEAAALLKNIAELGGGQIGNKL